MFVGKNGMSVLSSLLSPAIDTLFSNVIQCIFPTFSYENDEYFHEFLTVYLWKTNPNLVKIMILSSNSFRIKASYVPTIMILYLIRKEPTNFSFPKVELFQQFVKGRYYLSDWLSLRP